MKKWLKTALIIAVAGAIATGAYLQFRPAAVNADAVVTTATVTRGTISSYVSAVGNLQAHQTLDLSFGQSGTVKTVDVQLGDAVKAGDVLAELDTTELALQLQSAQVSLENARINLAEAQAPTGDADVAAARAAVNSAKAAYDSAVASANAGDSSLASAAASLEKAAITLQSAQGAYDKVSWRGDIAATSEAASLQTATIDHETAKAAYESIAATSGTDAASKVASALASLKSTQANLNTSLAGANANAVALAENSVKTAQIALDQVKLELAGAQIVAPFDGVVTALNVTPGEAGGSGAFTIADLSQMEVVVSMAETDVNQIKEGQGVEITLDAVSDLTLAGTVSQIAPSGTQSSGVVTYPVTVVLTDADEAARAGMTANLNIILSQRENVLTVPNKYVKTVEGQKMVTVNTNGAQVPVPVEVGLTDDTHTEIVSGLNEGDVVVSTSTGSTTTSATTQAGQGAAGMMGGVLGGDGMPPAGAGGPAGG